MESDRYKPSSEADHYSPEEMMARLKRNEQKKQRPITEQTGELVTREDGSQAIKVRRRKRRSEQPQKKRAKTRKKFKWAILGSLAAIVLITTIGTIYILARYNGSSFKQDTENTIVQLSGANEVEITQLRITPISAKAKKVELIWDQNCFLDSVSLHHLEANVLATSFVSNDWIGEEIVASQAQVYIKTPVNPTKTVEKKANSPYKFGAYRCNQLDLHFGRNTEAPVLEDMRASLWILPDGRSQIAFNNGKMIMKGWPELEISSGIATLNAENVDVELLLEANNSHQGELKIKGFIRKTHNQPAKLEVNAKNYPIEELLGKRLGRLINGKISAEMGTLQYHYNQLPSKSLSFVMPFRSNEIQMTEFPMFNDLKNLLGDTQYVDPAFNDCTGILRRTSEGVILEEIDFKSPSILTLKGQIIVQNSGKMSGELIVNLPRRLFSPGTAPPGFTGPHDGVYTANVKIGGSVHNPYDNLNEILRRDRQYNTQRPKKITIPNIPDTKPLTLDEKEREFEELTR